MKRGDSFFKLPSRKQALVITICLSGIVVVSALAINSFWNQLPTDGDGTAQQKTEVASLLCEWQPSTVAGYFVVNITNQHDFRVFGVIARGQFKNGSLLILELAPPDDTLEPLQSHIVNRAGNAEDIHDINASGYYLVGTDNTE